MNIQFDTTTDHLTIEADLDSLKSSRSGQTTILATTHGQRVVGMRNGKPIYAQVNIFQMNSETPDMFVQEPGGQSKVTEAPVRPLKRAA